MPLTPKNQSMKIPYMYPKWYILFACTLLGHEYDAIFFPSYGKPCYLKYMYWVNIYVYMVFHLNKVFVSKYRNIILANWYLSECLILFMSSNSHLA
jgi:hypothetical protein